MPTYGYQCKECKHEFSVFQSMKEDPIATCPECTGAVKRLLYPVGIVFKGSGWYINDSRKPEKSDNSDNKAADLDKETPKADGNKSEETKPSETKAEPKSEASSTASASTAVSEKT